DAVGITFFGEREAVKLAFADTGTAVPEQAAPHDSLLTAQPLGDLAGLAVPNTLAPGFVNSGKVFVVSALDVIGSVDQVNGRSEDDYYSFTGRQGDLFNFQVLSNSLTRVANAIDSVLRVYDAAGNLLATDDDEFETRDSTVVDFRLPADGTYYVEVDTFTPD